MEEPIEDGQESRESVLGFKPQNEIVYNKLLPYASRLDEESQEQLAEIKVNLSKAILLRDIRPGAIHWSVRLHRYIYLHGRKFSKEDHILFIKLFYELITLPEVEPQLLVKFCNVLILLLKKKSLLSRDDLQLPWKPLYKLYNHLFYTSYEVLGLLLLPSGIDKVIKNVIRRCRAYFPVESTKEMLEEWRPLMCPYDVTMAKAMTYFELFLSSNLEPKDHDQGFKLWFEDFMNIWEGTHNRPSWESKLIKLFTRVACNNIGYINWDPYIPMIFTRILRSFNLPVGCIKQIKTGLGTFQHSVTERWIIAMLGNSKACQQQLNDLFKALESYYHPSNTGRWIISLYNLLSKLPETIVKRIQRERKLDFEWMNPIPDSHKLTEDEITEFVECIMPCVMLAMFSKVGSADAAIALRNLSILRPKLVIPALLERLYPALETLTEPHRLMATMNCIVSVGPVLVRGGPEFSEGPCHVVPLLKLTLPGIDPNDIKKCMMTFQFISTFSTLIHLVDCSEAVSSCDDLTEIEKEVCLSTIHFEDFVLEFMDRCFQLIQNSVLEHTTRLDNETENMNTEEGMLEVGLSSTFTAILAQASPAIYKSALSKLKNFISGKVLETKVSGKYATNMVRSAVKVNPEIGLKIFLPGICKTIMSLISNPEVLKEEILDDELMFNLLLLSEILLCDGQHCLPYKREIQEVLALTLQLESRSGYKLAAMALKNVFHRISCIYPLNFSNVSPHAGKPFSQYLPIRDWGIPASVHDLGLKWHVPNDEEISWGSEMLEQLLVPRLQELNDFVNGSLTLSREQLLRSLIIIQQSLIGSAALLPLWKEDAISLIDCAVPVFQKPPVDAVHDKGFQVPGQTNIRFNVAQTMNKLAAYMLANCEDDTKSLCHVILIFQTVLFAWGTNEAAYEKRSKGFQCVKQVLCNKLNGKKRRIRALLVDRVLLQHERRSLEQTYYPFSSTCESIMKTLLNLATSHYSVVRIKSQAVLGESFYMFPYSQTAFLSSLLDHLKKDPTIAHEQFKGALYVLLGKKDRSMLLNHRWDVITKLWPALIRLKHSEKPSIIKLLNHIMDCINKKFTTMNINTVLTPPCIQAASILSHDEKNDKISSQKPCEMEIAKAEQRCLETNKSNMASYEKLVDDIAALMEENNLHWQHYGMAAQMLHLLIRHDVPLSPRAVGLFFDLLIHDTLRIRKIAIEACGCILKQQKLTFKKIPIDLASASSLSNSGSSSAAYSTLDKPMFGHRKDNLWLLYNKSCLPDTAEKFKQSVFVHKTHWGFYTWPKNFEVYSQDQDYYNSSESMPENVKEVHERFSQKEYVNKLLDFLSLEEKKGKDKFDSKRFYLFKGLFRNFQDSFLPLLKEHLKENSASTSESKQRCAMEIIAALIRGSKYWEFPKMQELESYIVPVLKSALSSMTNDTVSDWGTCIATSMESRDPNKYHWLIELLVDDPLKGAEGSFLSSSRLYVMLGGLGQQEWRIPEVLHRVLNYLIPHLTDSYQSVRNGISSMLTNTFLYDTLMKNCSKTLCPTRHDFIEQIMPALDILNQNGIKSSVTEESGEDSNNHIVPNHWEDSEKKKGKNLLKTICRWLTTMISRSPYSVTPDIFQFLPLLCYYGSDTTDEELRKSCCLSLAMIGQAFLLPESIDASLATIKRIISSKSWHSRSSVITYLQVMVFYNFFTIKQRGDWIVSIIDIVCEKLSDDQVEVRENAAVTLSGLLHCKFIDVSDELIDKFKAMSHGKAKKNLSAEALIRRHAGVLGLCACVDAHPYDVPQYIPDILMLLGDHLHDPQPILTTVRKSLSNFKRTHHDSWRDHKLKFSDDQLVVLTDLLVSPSYYA